MKVRAKLGRQSLIIDFGDETASTITLGSLRQQVKTVFNLEDQDFQLSLNKKDILTGDETLLSDLGIVSGDLLHILGPQNQQPDVSSRPSRPQPLPTYSSSDSHVTSLREPKSEHETSRHWNAASPGAAKTQQSLGATSSNDARLEQEEKMEAQPGPVQDSETNRYLNEPLVVRESTGSQVPALLSQLYSSSSCTVQSDALWVVLHSLMLESGFLSTNMQDPTMMPPEWKKAGYYACAYQFPVSAELTVPCSLVGVTVGSSMAVHGLSGRDSDFKTDHLQLKSANFIRTLSTDVPAVYRSLDRLSRQFKDTVCLQLINHLVTAAGFRERQGLLAMPCEVRLRVMSFLDARSLCRLGQVCQQMNAIYKERTIWRRLYLSNFGRPENTSLSRKWYKLYSLKYLQEQQAQEERRHQLRFLDDFQPGFPFHPFNPHRPFPPNIIGGDHDLNPEFGGGISGPMGRGGGGHFLPGLVPPNVVPTRMGEQLFRPRQSHNSLTGLPFSSQFP